MVPEAAAELLGLFAIGDFPPCRSVGRTSPATQKPGRRQVVRLASFFVGENLGERGNVDYDGAGGTLDTARAHAEAGFTVVTHGEPRADPYRGAVP